MADDLSGYVPSGGGGPMESAYQWLQDKAHTVTHLFSPGSSYDPNDPNQQSIYSQDAGDQQNIKPVTEKPTDQQQTFLQKVGQAAGKAGKNLGSSQLPGGAREFGFSTIPEHLYSRGFDNPLSTPKPAAKSRAAQSENPEAVNHQWYNDMREFGYRGGK